MAVVAGRLVMYYFENENGPNQFRASLKYFDLKVSTIFRLSRNVRNLLRKILSSTALKNFHEILLLIKVSIPVSELLLYPADIIIIESRLKLDKLR